MINELHDQKDTLLTKRSNGGAGKGGSGVKPAARRGRPTLLKSVLEALADTKAEDVVTIDLDGKSSIADQMVIASGRSHRQVGAIADRILKRLKEDGRGRGRVEGMPTCDWVLIDAGDVIVHVFRPEVREFYNLEKMWLADRPDDQLAV